MGKNYIEEIKYTHDLILGEWFKIIHNKNFYEMEVRFEKTDGRLNILNKDDENLFVPLLDVLEGSAIIKKIKPKTLMEQLKEQGFGWLISQVGTIRKLYMETKDSSADIGVLYCSEETFEKSVKMFNIFLTESEAEREVYRRKLEFEMQEWARKMGCGEKEYLHGITYNFVDNEVTTSINSNSKYVITPKMFGVSFDTGEKATECRALFSDKIKKYYNWEE